MKLSLITICHNREAHLRNLLLGLSRSTRLPDEVIIVSSYPLSFETDLNHLPIRSLVLPIVNENFDIGAARNAGAQRAEHEVLVFLDVDCVPAPDFIEKLAAHAGQQEGLIMGNPRYLVQPPPQNWQTADLLAYSDFHPHHPEPTLPLKKEYNYGMFWSLCFAIRRSDFARLGGFDEDFRGYGAEDTDFAFRAKALGLSFFIADARVFHQQHPVYRPPVNHFTDIVRNAYIFYEKWKTWPMEGWLSRFAAMGLIDWAGPAATSLRVLAQPDAATLAACYRPEAPYV